MRKVIYALSSYTAQSVKAKLVTAKWGMRIKDKFLARWQESHHKAEKIHRMCSILQEQSALIHIRAFMLKLEDAGHYMVFKKHIDGKLKSKALQVLK